VFDIVLVRMMAAAVRAVRQALDFHPTARALAVCMIALIVALGIFGGIATVLTAGVSS
jgi:hypothetical protein